jgi:hypothetical protein
MPKASQVKSYSVGEHEGSAQRKPQGPARWGRVVVMPSPIFGLYGCGESSVKNSQILAYWKHKNWDHGQPPGRGEPTQANGCAFYYRLQL